MVTRTITKRGVYKILAGIFLFIIDIIFKQLFNGSWLKYRWNFIDGFFSLALQKNQGISYGLNINDWVVIILSIFILIVLVFFLTREIKKKEINFSIPLLIIILGALSNFIDRLFHGYVIDYIHVIKLISFNIADLMILFGAFWLIIIYIQKDNLTASTKTDNLI